MTPKKGLNKSQPTQQPQKRKSISAPTPDPDPCLDSKKQYSRQKKKWEIHQSKNIIV
jgi:hypothetical protein